MLISATWRLKLQSSSTPQNSRPTMAPPGDGDMSPADDIYRELFLGVRTLHPGVAEDPRQTTAPAHHIRYTNWVPSTTPIENLQSLVASLKRSKAGKTTIDEAKKRLREAGLERYTKARKKNWGTITDAFKQQNAKAAFAMLNQGKRRPPRKRFTRRDHNKEVRRYKTVYSDPPQQPPILPSDENKILYSTGTPISTHQSALFKAFNPHTADATFVDGSFTEKIAARDATESTTATAACAAKCGWAAYNKHRHQNRSLRISRPKRRALGKSR